MTTTATLILMSAMLAGAAGAPGQTTAPPAQATPEPVPARLAEVRNVYLLRMARGLDQYLANQLTRTAAMVVVTDPEGADAILTDRVGKSLEEELARIYPAPKPAEPAPSPDDAPESESGNKPSLDKLSSSPVEGTWGRGRGTVFLVDRQSRRILWSMYAPLSGSTPDDLNKTAGKITGQLQKDLLQLKSPSK